MCGKGAKKEQAGKGGNQEGAHNRSPLYFKERMEKGLAPASAGGCMQGRGRGPRCMPCQTVS